MVLEHGSGDRPAFCWYQIRDSNVAALSMLLSLCWRMVCWHLAGVCYETNCTELPSPEEEKL